MPAPHCVTRGEGPVVLLLHGIGGGHESWAPQLDVLSVTYCAAAWDMPGYGESPPLAAMTFAGLADSLVELLDERGWGEIHLVGHSMGGMVAQQFAATHQDRLKSLTLSATSPAFGNPSGDFQKTFVSERLAPLDAGGSMRDLAQGLVDGFMGADAAPGALEAAIRCMERVPEATYRAAIECLVTFEQRANLPHIRVPTLVLAGGADRNAPAPMMEKTASKIPGARYICFDGAGHLANMERPDAFNQVLTEFIDEARGG